MAKPPNLKKLRDEFAGVGPFRPGEQTGIAIKRAQSTQKAIMSLSKSKGISIEKAKGELVKTAERVQKTRLKLRELRRQPGRRSSVGSKELASRSGHGSIRLAEHVLRTSPSRRR
jgi:hypothetical protein